MEGVAAARPIMVMATVVRAGRRRVKAAGMVVRLRRRKAMAAALRWAVRLQAKVRAAVAVVIPEGRRKSMKVAEATAADRETTAARRYTTRYGMARNDFAPTCT
jgi:hypothetical protein